MDCFLAIINGVLHHHYEGCSHRLLLAKSACSCFNVSGLRHRVSLIYG